MIKKLRLVILLFFIACTIFPQEKEFTLQKIFKSSEFRGERLSKVQWLKDGEKFSYLKYDTTSKSRALFVHNIENGETTVKLTKKELTYGEDSSEINFRHYKWSPDNRYIVFTSLLRARDIKTGGDFYIYDVEKGEIIDALEYEGEQMLAGFSPDSKKLGFVRDNNLFVYFIETGEIKQLTNNGSEVIINGNFDWVYEEEFSIIKGWDWSPDSKKIAFWRLDQSKVPEIKVAKWDSLYFNFIEMRYPKAGGPSSEVKIGVVDIQTGNKNWINFENDSDYYIPRMEFTADPNIVSVQKLNRLQNNLELYFYDIENDKKKLVLVEKDEHWVDVYDDLTFLKAQRQFIWSSRKNGYKHLYLYDYEGNQVQQLTNGKWELDNLEAVNEDKEEIYFTSNKRGTIYKDLYKTNFDGDEAELLTEGTGTHSITASPNGKYFIDSYSSVKNMPVAKVITEDGEEVENLVENDMSKLEGYEISEMEFLQFETTDGVKLNAAMIKPHDLDEDKKYPVLFYNYSGPGSQIITDSWKSTNYLWYQFLADKGYLIFMLDNRGTGGRGKEFEHLAYKNLGKWEINDLKEGVKYLSSLSYVDTSRVGIWGWSYGGYTSALALAKAPEYFDVAVSVAPVTNWRFYDNIYTERFMSKPELNQEGYKNGSILNYVENIEGSLLLVHGTADINVHFQNSTKLVDGLIANNVQFQTMYYPGRNHGIYGNNARFHLFKMITDFVLENL